MRHLLVRDDRPLHVHGQPPLSLAPLVCRPEILPLLFSTAAYYTRSTPPSSLSCIVCLIHFAFGSCSVVCISVTCRWKDSASEESLRPAILTLNL